jgi:tetratricopeptide (TPR) repeat protein
VAVPEDKWQTAVRQFAQAGIRFSSSLFSPGMLLLSRSTITWSKGNGAEQRSIERAHEPIRRALELNPNDWRANRFAADELFGTGRYDEMYFYLRKCFAVNPTDSYAPNLLGYICWTVGQNDLAEKRMQRAIDVETDLQGKLIMECERSVLRGHYAKAALGLEQLPLGFYSYTFSASGLLIDCMVHLKDWPGLLQLIAVLKQAGGTQPLLRKARASSV